LVTFRREDRSRVAAGEITVTFRLWTSAHVKTGKTYQTGFGAVEIEDVRVVPAALITEEDVALSGCPDADAVRKLAGEHTQTAVGSDTLLYRVQIRYLGVSSGRPRNRALPDLKELAERLTRMDRLARPGPWTLATLRLIDAARRVPARVLAAELGYEAADFKANVRKLKALGLTISHEVGYELSGLGRAYVDSVSPDPP
jgi:hypothetical protein